MSNPSMEWPENDIAFLRENWGKEGVSASKIGRQLGGRSKSSVVGKAHRMGLERLIASPIRQRPVNQEKRATAKREYARRRRAARKAGLPETKEQRAAIPLPTLSAIETFRAIADKPFKQEAADMPTFVKPPPPEPATFRSGSKCCWPLGDPGTADFKFCDEPVFKRSYCEKHFNIGYVRVRDRREDAA
jgi:GcrA cell cycle regulator